MIRFIHRYQSIQSVSQSVFLPYLILPFPLLPCPVLSLIILSSILLPCHALSCPVLSLPSLQCSSTILSFREVVNEHSSLWTLGRQIQSMIPQGLRSLFDPFLAMIYDSKFINLDTEHFKRAVIENVGESTFQEGSKFLEEIFNVFYLSIILLIQPYLPRVILI